MNKTLLMAGVASLIAFNANAVDFKPYIGADIGYSDNEDKTAFRVGAGAQYNFDDNWAIRGMLRHIFVDSYAVDTLTELSAGIKYNF